MASRFALLHWVIYACLSIVSIRAADLAPASEYEGKPIAEIRFDPVQQPVVRAERARLLPFQPGMPLHLAEVQAAIKRLYATGEYSNIEVEAQPAANGVVVVIHTTEQWFVGPVEVHGSIKTPPNAGQLANATRLALGTPYDDSDLGGATDNIRDLLQRNGLYRAKIEPQVSRDAEHQDMILDFHVDAGKRARLSLPQIDGDTKIGAAILAKAAKYKGWFRWKPATEENTQRGLYNIRKKYEKQDRLTASVTLDHTDYLAEQNRVRPTITADGGPRIKFLTEGAKISKGKLEEYVPVFDEETVNRDLLVNGARNLRDYYQNEGYFDVQVDFSSKEVTSDLRDITYSIGLGERHKVVKVDIVGNRYFKTSDISDRIYIHKAGFIQLRHGRYSDSFAKRDADAIAALYHANGFQDCKVAVEAQDDYQGRKGDVAVTIRIDEGRQYLVSAVNVEGMERPDRATILALLAEQPGQPYSQDSIAIDRNYLLELYQSEGYPDVTFDYSASPAGPDRMAVTYRIKPGEPRYVRDVVIYGLHRTSMRIVKPTILLQPGDPLSWTRMGVMQRRLYNLGVFDKVDMAIQNEQGETENKYVLFHMVEGHLYDMAVGFGAEIAQIGGSSSSLNNPAGTTGFAPRADFEISRLNLWGLGHSLNFKSRYSTLDRQVSLNYLAPRFRNVNGQNISVTALYDNIRDVLTFTGRRVEGSVQLSQRHSKATTFLWRYTWRDVSVNSTDLKINPELIPIVSQAARVAMIGGNVIQDRRDDPVNAHRGVYNSFDLALVDRIFGGNKNYTRFLGRNSFYKQVKTNWVLASNTVFGWIHPFGLPSGETPFDYVPLPEHFFGGGSTSMRGFPDNQAGPRDLVTGFPLGGDALLMHQTELRFPLLGENINGVLFEDMGNVYTDLSSISFRVHQNGYQDFDYMVHAAGFGIRYRTPVGPLRIDLAYTLNPPTFYGLKGTYDQLLFGGATSTIQSVGHFHFFISIGQAF
jgi:outer membrane protein assembly complex protein YaeT